MREISFLTFNVDTRSAVSSSVNWLIWSTMVDILGLAVDAAASVDCHLRDSWCRLRGAVDAANRSVLAWEDRRHWAHRRAAN